MQLMQFHKWDVMILIQKLSIAESEVNDAKWAYQTESQNFQIHSSNISNCNFYHVFKFLLGCKFNILFLYFKLLKIMIEICQLGRISIIQPLIIRHDFLTARTWLFPTEHDGNRLLGQVLNMRMVFCIFFSN